MNYHEIKHTSGFMNLVIQALELKQECFKKVYGIYVQIHFEGLTTASLSPIFSFQPLHETSSFCHAHHAFSESVHIYIRVLVCQIYRLNLRTIHPHIPSKCIFERPPYYGDNSSITLTIRELRHWVLQAFV